MTAANDAIPDSVRNRLSWQCRRGMRELDELLQSFLAQHLAGLDKNGQEAFEILLKYPDAVLLELFTDEGVGTLIRA